MADVEKAFTKAEIAQMRQHFDVFDADKSGAISDKELSNVLAKIGEKATPEAVKKLIQEADLDKSGQIDWPEFLHIVHQLRTGGKSSFGNVIAKSKNLIDVKGATGSHSFSEEEKESFANHINEVLSQDPHAALMGLPLKVEDMSLFDSLKNGILLNKLVNVAVPATVDERAINLKAKLNEWEINENHNLALNSAKSIGCTVVNVGAEDLKQGNPILGLGLIWQIIKIEVLSSINLKNHPELWRLLEDGEEIGDLLKLPPEQILIRWFNYHLKAANSPRRVKNFSSDIKDSECYTVLLHQLAGDQCDLAALNESDPTKRANLVLANADKIGCKKFVAARDIVNGNPKLNLAFVATIFNTLPGLAPLNEEEFAAAGLIDDDAGDNREERAYRMWINSLAIDGVYVNNLFEDLKDGVVLLKVFDKVQPGIVSWKSVNNPCTSRFKKVENCNYAVTLGKQLKFSLVNISGLDIVDGSKKLLLALMWQLMRLHTVNMLSKIHKDGHPPTDEELIRWANERVKGAGKSSRQMKDMKDKTLSDGLFFIDLLAGIESRAINWDLGKDPAGTDDDKMMNAKYVISIARRLGCTIFLLWEDIVEVKPKMILTLVGSIMLADSELKAAKRS